MRQRKQNRLDVMKMSIRKTKFRKTLRRNAPNIFKIAGLIGLIAAPIITVPSTVKAVRACDKRKEELGVEKLPVGEIVKTSWKHYIPVISLMGASTASMVNGESISRKRTAVLSAAYDAANTTIQDYKDEVKKKLGEKDAKEIERSVIEKQVQSQPPQTALVPIQGSENGGVLFREPMTGTYFYSTRNKVDKAFNELTAQMLRENYVDLGDLFDLLDLNVVEVCHLIGWNSMRVKSIEPEYNWFGIEESATPYVSLGYNLYPTSNYIDV